MEFTAQNKKGFESFVNSDRYKALMLIPIVLSLFESFVNSDRYKA